MNNKIEIYSDGACSGNPGPGGYGAIVVYKGQEYPLSGGEKPTTNNRMELLGAIKALQFVVDNHFEGNITVTTDSQYVKNGIYGPKAWIINWKKNGWKTANKEPVKNQDLWQQLDSLQNRLNPEWHWVKGHNGHPYNERCDQLAVEASRSV